MRPLVTLFALLLIGFVVYSLFRDHLFDSADMEPFVAQSPSALLSPAPVLVRQAPVYPERNISPSGPSPPSQAPSTDEMVVYGPPQASDPYQGEQESSEIPETLRHPERAYRPAPAQQHTAIAQQAGLASPVSSGPASSTEMIQNGGEFMSGVFANDSFDDTSFSAF
jgi:hypothetical protein